MRANAPITAILALAALSLSPTPLIARPRHAAPKAAVSATRQQHSHKKTSPAAKPHKPTHKAHRQRSADAPDPVAVTRVHSWVKPRHQSNAVAPGTNPRTATSDDFVKAATTLSPEADPNANVARQTSVLNVIRTTGNSPQLQPIDDMAATNTILPSLYNKRGRLIVPPPLKGSHEILLRQNQVADREGLDRIQNDDDIVAMRNRGMLLALPTSPALQVDERLPASRRYCRPWTAQFLATLARAHYARFHTPLQVNSAVRTVEFQQHLLRTNGNAAPAEGDTASPHLTGQAIDLAKHGLSLSEIAWLRGYLLPLVQQGKVDVEEEFQQSCFHISVYKKYLPPSTVPTHDLASSHHGQTPALATAVR